MSRTDLQSSGCKSDILYNGVFTDVRMIYTQLSRLTFTYDIRLAKKKCNISVTTIFIRTY